MGGVVLAFWKQISLQLWVHVQLFHHWNIFLTVTKLSFHGYGCCCNTRVVNESWLWIARVLSNHMWRCRQRPPQTVIGRYSRLYSTPTKSTHLSSCPTYLFLVPSNQSRPLGPTQHIKQGRGGTASNQNKWRCIQWWRQIEAEGGVRKTKRNWRVWEGNG